MTPNNQPLPHNLDAEQHILGILLRTPDALPHVMPVLKADDFYADSNKAVYKAILELHDSNLGINITTTADRLRSNGALDQAGGLAYLAQLAALASLAEDPETFAAIINEDAQRRRLIAAGTAIRKIASDESLSAEALLSAASDTVMRATMDASRRGFEHASKTVSSVLSSPNSLSDIATGITGISTGFPTIDDRIDGAKRQELIIVAARPSMGKTALALSMTHALTKKGYAVGFLSLEMGKAQLIQRLLASMSAVESKKIIRGGRDHAENQRLHTARKELDTLPLYICEAGASTVPELRAFAMQLKSMHKLDIIIVDYLQLMSSATKSFSREQEISEISRNLKRLAKELDIPVIALSQLSRAVESRPDKRPQLSDLRESGAIEQDADIVMMLYRDDYYNELSENQGTLDVYVRKNRNGETGQIELLFNKKTQEITEKNAMRFESPTGNPPKRPEFGGGFLDDMGDGNGW